MMNGLETDVESRSEIETEQQRYHKDIAEIIVISPECDATYVIKLHFPGGVWQYVAKSKYDTHDNKNKAW